MAYGHGPHALNVASEYADPLLSVDLIYVDRDAKPMVRSDGSCATLQPLITEDGCTSRWRSEQRSGCSDASADQAKDAVLSALIGLELHLPLLNERSLSRPEALRDLTERARPRERIAATDLPQEVLARHAAKVVLLLSRNAELLSQRQLAAPRGTPQRFSIRLEVAERLDAHAACLEAWTELLGQAFPERFLLSRKIPLQPRIDWQFAPKRRKAPLS